MIEIMMETIFLYSRLILYPVLAFSFFIFSYSGRGGGCAKSRRLHVMISFLFVILWCTSIVAYISPTIMRQFDDYALIPFLIFLLVYVWIQTIRHNCEWTNSIKKEK